MGRAEDLFGQLVRGGAQAIHQLVLDHVTEQLSGGLQESF